MSTNLHFNPNPLPLDQVDLLKKFLAEITSQVDWAGIRYVQEITHWRGTRDEKPDINSLSIEKGVCIEVLLGGQFAYGTTSDLSPAGLLRAFQKARDMAVAIGRHGVFSFTKSHRPTVTGRFSSHHNEPLDQTSLAEVTDFLMGANKRLRVSEKIVNSQALAMIVDCEIRLLSTNGTDVEQKFLLMGQHYSATAQDGGEAQTRTLNGSLNRCYQAGPEVFDKDRIFVECERVGREAVELLTAEECPSDIRDLLIDPDQMTLQIHESVGHPLELDRILGDERNYAGWSFVKPGDFGKLQYGSKQMSISFDPTVTGEYASYAFDDSGNQATREYLIKDGLLERGLGGVDSQKRLKLPGVANFRSSSWNRAPIDRMANINLEPGHAPLAEMIANTKKGIYMQSNRSWSIDDYRNKFQFGCEYARLIEDGKLTKIIKNPNYRGATVQFWNSLKALGPASEVQTFGSPNCGKGEPSQVIRVGHSAPPCLFSNVQIFGGGK